MATYAIGDIQGCYRSFQNLLSLINFSHEDRLWLAGDLVNRGPQSLEVLRFVKSLGNRAISVLGNHDLHLLAIRSGLTSRKLGKTLRPIIQAPDCDELLDWLQQQPMLAEDRELGYVMTHAGLPHIWSLSQARGYAREIEQALRGDGAADFFANMYGDEPRGWSERLEGPERLRTLTNYFTRMRFIDAAGNLDFSANEGLDSQPPGYLPWFRQPRREPLPARILCGHWAALGFYETDEMIALDSGCVWGNRLTAVRLEDRAQFSVPSAEQTAQ